MAFRKLFNNAVQASPLIGAFAAATYVSGGSLIFLGGVTACALVPFALNFFKNKSNDNSQVFEQSPERLQNRFNQLVQEKDQPIQLFVIKGEEFSSNAFYDPINRRIAIGEGHAEKLSNDEFDFAAAHELEHIHQDTPYVAYFANKILEVTLVMSMAALTLAELNDKVMDVRILPICIGGWLVQSALTSRLFQENELRCDAGAVNRIGNTDGALSYFRNHDKSTDSYNRLHPSASERECAILSNTFARPKHNVA